MAIVPNQTLAQTAQKIRKGIIESVYRAKSGHPGGSLSIADLLSFLYFEEMKVDPKNPKWEGRDRLVLSKGHTAPGLYSTLALKGFFEQQELQKLRKTDGMLQGHPDMKHIPGVDMTTGSLGQGISAAAGMALAAKLSGASYRVYAILGDGELQEGQVWEAAMFAAHNKLDKLLIYVDNNGLQIDGAVDEVCSPYPIRDKFEAFGWTVYEVDGHSFDELRTATEAAKKIEGSPCAIIMKTSKGKGVSFMENNRGWHGAAPNEEQYQQAMRELDEQAAKREKLES